MPRLYLSLLLSLVIASSGSAVTMDWTFIGDPGNPSESGPPMCGSYPNFQPCGSVAYTYQIGTYEVTNAQYAEFLNAKGASDPFGLYATVMGSAGNGGGIIRTGNSGTYTYSTIAGRENWPVFYVSLWDAFRFANWMNNGQGSGDTETGSYTLGGTPEPSNLLLTRNVGATIVLPSEDEWYKAAYYSAITTSYFDFPAGFDAEIGCSTPTAEPNRASCNFSNGGDVVPVGSYPGSPSPYGTFDQGGNVSEWVDSVAGGLRIYRGGDRDYPAWALAASVRSTSSAGIQSAIGFRVAMIVPEPGTGLLVIAGLLGLAGWRGKRPSRPSDQRKAESCAAPDTPCSVLGISRALRH